MQIFNIYYNIIYTLFAITVFIYATSPKVIIAENINKQLIILFSFLFFLVFGSRAISVGTDTFRYVALLQSNREFKDIGFNIYVNLIRLISNNERFFLYALSFAFMLPICIYFLKIKNENRIILFFIFVSLFSFKNLGINIMRQGIAVSFFFLSIYFLDKKKNILSLLLCILSISFQASMIIPVIFYIISTRIKAIIIPIVCFFIASVLAILNFDFPQFFKTIPLIGSWSFITNRLDSIINSAERVYYYRTGFRFDFFIYNLFFAILGLFAYKKAITIFSKYKIYLSVYLFASSIFFLMFKFPFSDRYGILSWIFIPFIFLPYVQKEGILNKYGRTFTFLLIIAINIFMSIIQG